MEQNQVAAPYRPGKIIPVDHPGQCAVQPPKPHIREVMDHLAERLVALEDRAELLLQRLQPVLTQGAATTCPTETPSISTPLADEIQMSINRVHSIRDLVEDALARLSL